MRDFFRGKFFITLVFIACFLAGFMLNMLLDGGVTAPRDLIGFIATPFASFGTWVKNGTEDIINTFAEFSELQKENEELKKQVAKLLSTHPLVESFRPGGLKEGGDGVSIVTLG